MEISAAQLQAALKKEMPGAKFFYNEEPNYDMCTYRIGVPSYYYQVAITFEDIQQTGGESVRWNLNNGIAQLRDKVIHDFGLDTRVEERQAKAVKLALNEAYKKITAARNGHLGSLFDRDLHIANGLELALEILEKF